VLSAVSLPSPGFLKDNSRSPGRVVGKYGTQSSRGAAAAASAEHGDENGNAELLLEESTLSSRDMSQEGKEDRGDMELPHYGVSHSLSPSHSHKPAMGEEKDSSFGDSPPGRGGDGVHPDDLSLDLSQALHDSLPAPQGSELQDELSLLTPLGIPLSEYQLTAEFPPFRAYQCLLSSQEEEEEEEEGEEDNRTLSILLAFQLPVTKRDIAISVDEEAQFIDSIVIGVTAVPQEEEEGGRATETYALQLQLLSHIDASTLHTKFNKHQVTLHITATAVTATAAAAAAAETEAEAEFDELSADKDSDID
jgi:hypothetical protein